MTTDQPVRPVIRVRAGELRQVMSDHGLTTDHDTARYLRISPSTLSRSLHGRPVGARFVATVLYLTPAVTFSDVFAIALEPMQAPEAAAA